MNKSILTIRVIALFIGMAVVPAGASLINPSLKNVEQYQTTETKSTPVTHHWKFARVWGSYTLGTFSEDHKILRFHFNIRIAGETTAASFIINGYEVPYWHDIEMTMTLFRGVVNKFVDGDTTYYGFSGLAFGVNLTEL